MLPAIPPQTPFTIKCDTGDDTVLGDVRWVTTSIARFDVRTSWPTDLSCSFAWNKQLKTFDGGCWGVAVNPAASNTAAVFFLE